MDAQTFTKQLKHPEPCYVFAGPEAYLADEAEKTALAAWVGADMALLNINRFEDKECDISDVLAACQTLPVMSPQRVVIVAGDALKRFSGKSAVTALKDYLRHPAPQTVLIIRAGAKVSKALSRVGTHVDFKRFTYGPLAAWLKAQAAQLEMRFGPQALERFIARTNYTNDTAVTAHALIKSLESVSAYAATRADGHITVADVEAVLEPSVDENAFDMLRALENGALGEAQEILGRLFSDGEDPVRVFGALVAQVRRTAMARLCLKRHLSPQETASICGLSPYALKYALAGARRAPAGALPGLIAEAADMDCKMKTGQILPEFAVSYFMLKMHRALSKKRA